MFGTVWNTFAFIGGAMVGVLVYQVLKEAVRAFRQGRRLAYVHARSRGDRKPSAKWIWKMALHDFCSSYDWTTVSSRIRHLIRRQERSGGSRSN